MSPENEVLASLSAICRTMVAGGHASCEEAADQIRQSRKAVARSLELLSKTNKQLGSASGTSRES